MTGDGLRKIFLVFLIAAGSGIAGHADGDRLYFTGLVEENSDTLQNQVLLIWGPMERAIPSEITGFRLYRRQSPGSFQLLAETSRDLADIATMTSLFTEAGEGHRYNEIVEWAYNDSGGDATGTAAIDYLHGKLSLVPGDPDYNPLEQLLLTRFNFNVARAVGQGYIDRTVVSPGVYEYMLTGLEGTAETLPLGKTTVDVGMETVLPMPEDFEQVFVADCEAISRGIDDRRVHLRWDIPIDPGEMSLRILTYGYDIYRSEVDLGALDLRNLALNDALPAELTRINDTPIIVAGNPPEEGRNSFMAIDEGDPFNHDFLQRGQTYFYYLVSRDLSGKYSETNGPILAMVPDTLPPPMPWGARSEEVWDPVTPTVKRVQIVWDEINAENYWREYGSAYDLVTPPDYANPMELYFVPKGEDPVRQNFREVDLETVKYTVFRFRTQEEAQEWGTDSDGDYWPDNIEEASGTDPCDAASNPGVPTNLVAEIDISDATTLRVLDTGVEQRFIVDTVPQPDNRVWWYKIIAWDPFGNQSPPTPPIRAVLWDREQPTVEGGLVLEDCDYRVVTRPDCQLAPPGSNVTYRFGVFDRTNGREQTGIAEGGVARLYEFCRESQTNRIRFILLAQKPIRNRAALFTLDDFDPFHCNFPCRNTDAGDLIVRFYDSEENLLGTSDPFNTVLCSVSQSDCFDLVEDCEEREPGPGEVIPPGELPEVCVDLEPGQRARVYQQLGGGMSPFLTIAATHETGIVEYCEPLDILGIVPTNTCLGLRVFNSNNVGSSMKFLNCVGLGAFSQEPPEPPLLHSVDPTGSDSSPAFTVRWAAQGPDGLAAFVLAWKHGAQIRYNTFWVGSSDLTYENGLYEVVLDLDPVMDVNVEWCFEVRVVDKILQSSGWSQELCNTWELGDPEQLPWPPVPDIPVGEDLTVYFFNHPTSMQPLLVLSDSLQGLFDDPECLTTNLTDCESRQEPCLKPISLGCYGFCDVLKAANRYGEFIVYRQEEGKDFVQVGPLVDTFFCFRNPPVNLGNTSLKADTLDDPYIFVVDPIVSDVSPSDLAGEVDGPRLVYADPYPVKAGTKVRYQLVQVDPVTGEGITVHYSNWLEIP